MSHPASNSLQPTLTFSAMKSDLDPGVPIKKKEVEEIAHEALSQLSLGIDPNRVRDCFNNFKRCIPRFEPLRAEQFQKVLEVIEQNDLTNLNVATTRFLAKFNEFFKQICGNQGSGILYAYVAFKDFIESQHEDKELSSLCNKMKKPLADFWNSHFESFLTPATSYNILKQCHLDKNFQTIRYAVKADDFFPILLTACQSQDWDFVQFLILRKPSQISWNFRVLAMLEKAMPQGKMQNFLPSILCELFRGTDAEILEIAKSQELYFLDWCLQMERFDLIDPILERLNEDPQKSTASLLSALDVFSKCSSPTARAVRVKILALLKQKPLSSFMLDMMKRGSKPVSEEEHAFLLELREHFPQLTRNFASWKALQDETDHLDLTPLRQVTLSSCGESFEAYDLAKEKFSFLVYAADFNKGTFESIRREKLDMKFLCTSLVTQDLSTFFKEESKYGLILSVDPQTIIKTTRQDAETPYQLKYEDVYGYYHLHERLILFTAYIDQLYLDAGLCQESETDPYVRLNQLLAKKRYELASCHDDEIEELRQRLKVAHQSPYEFLEDYKEKGSSLLKLEALLSFYENHVQKKKEIEELILVLKGLKGSPKFIHPIQNPKDLISQTSLQTPDPYNEKGLYVYNEVNVNLLSLGENEREKSIPVRGVLIDRYSFEQNPDAYFPVFSQAKGQSIPIFIKEDQTLSSEVVLDRLQRGASEGAGYPIRKILHTQKNMDADKAYQALTAAIHNPPSTSLKTILDAYPSFSESALKEAFDEALKRENAVAVLTLLHTYPSLLQAQALKALEREFSDVQLSIVLCFLSIQASVSSELLGKALQRAVYIGDLEKVKQLLLYAEEISNEDIQQAIRLEELRKKYIHSSFAVVDPKLPLRQGESCIEALLKCKAANKEENLMFYHQFCVELIGKR